MTTLNGAPPTVAVDMRPEALRLAHLGWRVLPVHNPTANGCTCKEGADCGKAGKHPRVKDWPNVATTDPEQIARWWQGDWRDTNIGLAMGRGRVAIDIDPAGLPYYQAHPELFLETVQADTPRGGLHLIYDGVPADVDLANKVGELAPGIDIRTDGGQIVAAPSLHYNGKRYRWTPGHSPFDRNPELIPSALLAALVALPAKSRNPAPWPAFTLPQSNDKQIPRGLQRYAEAGVGDGQRNTCAFWLACRLVEEVADERAGRDALELFGRRCNPALPSAEIATIWDSAHKATRYDPSKARHAPPPPAGAYRPDATVNESTATDSPNLQPPAADPSTALGERENLTDLGNARRLVRYYGAEMRYVRQWGWLAWDGRRWAIDDSIARRRAIDTVGRMYAEAAPLADEQRTALVKWALQSENASRLTAMLDVAKDFAGIVATPAAFDQDPWILNCRNGTVDLRTGELRPHDPGAASTKLAPVDFDPAATCPVWLAFLDRIFAGDTALINHVQRAIGYSLTGSTDEQVFFLLHGNGANGKSTLLTTLQRILGDYAQSTPAATLLVKKGDPGVNNDIARMVGARFVAAVETEPGKHLATALIKQLTGQDPISARFLHKEYFDFVPTLKLWFATNHRPKITDATDSIWRRVLLIPFAVRIPDDQKDPTLPSKLLAEAPGILAWMVQGALLWQRSGLQAPLTVQAATAAYRADQDQIAAFFAECCLPGRSHQAEFKLTYQTYVRWALDGNDPRPMGKQDFKRALEERGYYTENGHSNKVMVRGLGLRVTEYSDPPKDEHSQAPAKADRVNLVNAVNETAGILPSSVSRDENTRQTINQINQINPDTHTAGHCAHCGYEWLTFETPAAGCKCGAIPLAPGEDVLKARRCPHCHITDADYTAEPGTDTPRYVTHRCVTRPGARNGAQEGY